MIDTLVLKIHDVIHHEKLVKWLDAHSLKKGMTRKRIIIPEGEEDFSTRVKLNHKDAIQFHDKMRFVEVMSIDHLPSYHYSIAYKIDYNQDCIQFNLSIPKYLYSTNVFLFSPMPGDRDFVFHWHAELQNAKKYLYTNFIHFLKKFFFREFGEIPIDWRFLQVARIDFCYNQVFPNKQEALRYLEYCMKIKRKYHRAASDQRKDYKTTLMYVTDRYSFKVYHKGTEFRKNDRKQLVPLAEKYNYDIDSFQALADRTLRYEATFRNRYISDLYMQKLFRPYCEVWDFCMNIHQDDRSLARGKNHTNFLRNLTVLEKRALQFAKFHIGKTKDFYLSDRIENDFNLECKEDDIRNFHPQSYKFYYPSHFSRQLFGLLYDRFLEFVYEFELKEYTSDQIILERLQEYNLQQDAKKELLKKSPIRVKNDKNHQASRINPTRIRLFLNLLKNNTFDDVKGLGVYNERTFYRIKSDLKKLGVTDKDLADFAVKIDFSLKGYYTEISYMLRKIPKLFKI